MTIVALDGSGRAHGERQPPREYDLIDEVIRKACVLAIYGRWCGCGAVTRCLRGYDESE